MNTESFFWACLQNYGKYEINIHEFSTQLMNQFSKAWEEASMHRGKNHSVIRTYIINELGVEILIKMKVNRPSYPDMWKGKKETCSAKIKFLKADNIRVFNILKEFFTRQTTYFCHYYFDNVSIEKQGKLEYIIQNQKLVEEKLIQPNFSTDYYYIDPKFDF